MRRNWPEQSQRRRHGAWPQPSAAARARDVLRPV